MGRIKGVENHEAGWLTRFIFWMVKRKLGRVIEPVRITAHHPRLLKAMGQMEMGQEAARSVDAALKTLVSIKVAMQVGCPF
jgi:hypothetical protein